LRHLNEARNLLRWNLKLADLPASRSSQGRALAARAVALAAAQGVPQLRELVVKPYVLLYAHGEDRVLLLALKHERQWVFKLD
jgi:hypothetical protein